VAKIRYYQDSELEGLSDYEIEVRKLVSRIIHIDKYADPNELELLPIEELQRMALALEGEPEDKPARIAKHEPVQVKAFQKPAKPVLIEPNSIEEAYTLVNNQLMKRVCTLVEFFHLDGSKYTRQLERLVPCGDRVRFKDVTYSAKVVAHYLRTGEQVHRAPRARKDTRYRARVRVGTTLVHLGYFDTVGERDAAVFAYRLGVNPKSEN
jgi:hypothetical protein